MSVFKYYIPNKAADITSVSSIATSETIAEEFQSMGKYLTCLEQIFLKLFVVQFGISKLFFEMKAFFYFC